MIIAFFQAHYDLQMNTITPYYSSVINTTLDICAFFNGTSSNIATKWFLSTFAQSFPAEFIHPCSLIGEIKAYNLSFNEFPQQLQFLTGTYKAFTKFYDDKDDNIITSKLYVDVKEVKPYIARKPKEQVESKNQAIKSSQQN